MAEDDRGGGGEHQQQPPPHRRLSFVSHQILSLVLTFISYAAFQASRKPLLHCQIHPHIPLAPFNSNDRWPRLLGLLDLAFLSQYSLSMLLLSGPLLTVSPSCPSSSLLTISLFFFFKIHSLSFFLVTARYSQESSLSRGPASSLSSGIGLGRWMGRR